MNVVPVHSLYPPGGLLFDLKVRFRDHVMDQARVLDAVPPKGDVLDIGCGTGLLLMGLACRGHGDAMVGLDLSGAAITMARHAAGGGAALGWREPDFRLSAGVADWPARTFGTVCMVDVMHHVPEELRERFLSEALDRVAPGGTFVYKDMSGTPRWCGFGNRVHDLLLSGDMISYQPLARVRGAAAAAGLSVRERASWRQLWYAHELLVATRPA